MKKLEFLIMAILSGALLVSCEFDGLASGDFISKEYINIKCPKSVVFDKELEQTIHVEGNKTWEIKNVPDWLVVTPKNGLEEVVRIVAEPNPSTINRRSDTLEVISGCITKKIVVNQMPLDLFLSATPGSLVFPSFESRKTLSIRANSKWTITTNNDWCHVDYSGSGDEDVEVFCDANETGAERRDTICISSIYGLKNVAIPVSQSSSEWYLSARVENLEFSGLGESIKFQLSSNTKWDITTSHNWCQVSSFSGFGDQEIEVTIARNPTANTRTATLTIKSTTLGIDPVKIEISQRPGETPVLTIDEENVNFPHQGGQTKIQINSNIIWQAECVDEWCKVSPSEKVDGRGEISITVDSNPAMADARTTSIQIISELGTKTITVSQDKGAPGYITTSTASITLDPTEQKTTFEVESNISWTVSSSERWCVVSSDVTSMNGTVTISVAKNPGPKRESIITLKSVAKDIVISVCQGELMCPDADDNPNPYYSRNRR